MRQAGATGETGPTSRNQGWWKMVKRYVVYMRVSTAEQKRSGLGLEAQRRDCEIYLHSFTEEPWEVIGEFTDTGSGADNERPQYKAAVELAKRTGAELLVSKLDRLSRRVSQIALLMDDPKLKLRVASMPHADKFQLHVYAALAEQERTFISLRTKAALEAARIRGVKLGGARGGAANGAEAKKAKADAYAKKVGSLVETLKETRTNEEVAAELQRLEIARPSGGQWSATAVARLLERTRKLQLSLAVAASVAAVAGGHVCPIDGCEHGLAEHFELAAAAAAGVR